MNENAKKWVEDLRTTKKKQGKSYLHIKSSEGDKFCCLGLACVLFDQENPNVLSKMDSIRADANIVTYAENSAALPREVRKWLGLTSDFGAYNCYSQSLASDNDAGKAFAEIADIIEANEKELFVE